MSNSASSCHPSSIASTVADFTEMPSARAGAANARRKRAASPRRKRAFQAATGAAWKYEFEKGTRLIGSLVGVEINPLAAVNRTGNGTAGKEGPAGARPGAARQVMRPRYNLPLFTTAGQRPS